MGDQFLTPEIARDSAMWLQQQQARRRQVVPANPTQAGDPSARNGDADSAAADLHAGRFDGPPPVAAGSTTPVRSPEDKARAEADAIMRTTMMLNADRIGLNKTSVMLDALRGASDLDAMRRIFEERTGQKLDDWMVGQTGGAEKDEDKGLDQKEAEALLSGNQEDALLASLANCKKGDTEKLTAILATLPKGPDGKPDESMLALARGQWGIAHGGDTLDGRLSDAQRALLLEGEAGDAKGHEMRAARGFFNTDEGKIATLLRSAADQQQRDEMLLVYAQTKDPSISDPAAALAFFEKDAGKFSSGAEKDMFLALAKGDETGAAAAGLQVALEDGDLEGMNAAMEGGPSPNEPGLSPAERTQRLEAHKQRQEALEQAWTQKYGDPKSKETPSEQFGKMLEKAAEKGENPELEQRRLDAARGEGGMGFGLSAEYAVMNGDVDRVRDLMQGLDKDSITALDQYLDQKCGKNLGAVIAQTSGRENKALMRSYLYGDAPESDADKIAKARAIHEDELGSGAGALGGLAKMGGADERMDRNLGRIDALEKKLAAGGLGEDERAELDRTLQYMEGDAAGFQGDKDTVTRGASLVGKGLVGLGVGAATGGMGLGLSPALGALLTGAAAEGTGMLMKRLVQGDDYGGDQAKKDAIQALFKVGAAGVAGVAPVKEALDAAGAAVSGGHEVVKTMASGALSGGGQKLVETAGGKLAQRSAGEDTGGVEETVAEMATGTLEGALGGGVGGVAGDAVKSAGGGDVAQHLAGSGGKMVGQGTKRRLLDEDIKKGAEDDAADELGAVFGAG